MKNDNYAYFQVSTKLFLRQDDKILALVSGDNYLDFPGGRIDESEIDLPIEVAMQREITEELGKHLKFELIKPAFVCKRGYTKNGQDYRIIAIYYEAQYLGGKIVISKEHASFLWASPEQLLSGDYFFVSKDEEEKLKNHLLGQETETKN